MGCISIARTLFLGESTSTGLGAFFFAIWPFSIILGGDPSFPPRPLYEALIIITRHTKFAAGPRRYDEEFDWNCAVPWPALAISQKLT